MHLSKIYIIEDFFGNEILSEFLKKDRTIVDKMEIEQLLKSEHQ